MAEFGNGLAEESLLDSDPGHPELEDPGVGDEEPGLEEGEAAIEDPVSEGHCFGCWSPHEHQDTRYVPFGIVNVYRQPIWCYIFHKS